MAESPFGPRVARRTGDPSPTPAAAPAAPSRPDAPPPRKLEPTLPRKQEAPVPQRADAPMAKNSVAERGSKPAGKSNFLGTPQATQSATVIQTFVRALISFRVAQPKLQEYSTLVIQAEYRDYLYRTRNTRATLRRRRENDRLRLHQAVDAVVNATRLSGKAIVAAENIEWTNILTEFANTQFEPLAAEESRLRELLSLGEFADFTDIIDSHCPPYLNPDRKIESGEYRERNQVARLWRAELNALMLLHVAAKASDARRAQRSGREEIWIAEAKERASIVADSRTDFLEVRLASIPGVESKLRLLLENQRDDYIVGLRQQLLITVRMILCCSTTASEAEPVQRARIVARERVEVKLLWDLHRAGLFHLSTRELLDSEREARVGLYGLVRDESRMRARIMAAVVGVHIQLLQRSDLEDVRCEFGARTAIRWQEGREWYALMQKNAVVAASWMIPSEEHIARLTLLRSERDERDQMLRGAPMRQFLVAHEFAHRRAIFAVWCEGFMALAFTFARLQLRSFEELRRRQLLRTFEAEMLHLQATEYMWFAEMRDRDVLRQGKLRLQTQKMPWLRVRSNTL